ncbi:hypothetical protein LGR51_21960, partial [Pseudomonas sp. NP21570]|nr:hypothetical protein [Pseudomonas sp. NP21570]
ASSGNSGNGIGVFHQKREVFFRISLDMSDEARQQIEADGFVARLIHANEVVEDSAGRFPPGYWVRSSLQLRYEGDGFFETRSTIYVLLGVGRHKKVRDDIVYSIRP